MSCQAVLHGLPGWFKIPDMRDNHTDETAWVISCRDCSLHTPSLELRLGPECDLCLTFEFLEVQAVLGF